MVAIPLSTVSGVPVRSCDASLGAMTVAQMEYRIYETFDDGTVSGYGLIDGLLVAVTVTGLEAEIRFRVTNTS